MFFERSIKELLNHTFIFVGSNSELFWFDQGVEQNKGGIQRKIDRNGVMIQYIKTFILIENKI